MKIVTIKYRKYEEKVLLDENFVLDNLFLIILNDRDFMWFNIQDEQGKILLSSWYPDKESGAIFVSVAPNFKKEVEILGTTYNAYNTPSLIHRTKTSWKVGSHSYTRKRGAMEYIRQTNIRARLTIMSFLADKGQI
ncbi:hypothetical protein [Pedobacter sp.]